MYIGSWKIDDYLTFPLNVHDCTSHAACDADSAPTYRVYEDEVSTPVLTGAMSKLDDANTLGFYTERIQLTTANGFEKGKCYTIYISYLTGTEELTKSITFQIESEVDISESAVDAILDEEVEGTITLRQVQRLLIAFVAGLTSGGGSNSIAFRDQADSKDRLVQTVDSDGDRSNTTLDLT